MIGSAIAIGFWGVFTALAVYALAHDVARGLRSLRPVRPLAQVPERMEIFRAAELWTEDDDEAFWDEVRYRRWAGR